MLYEVITYTTTNPDFDTELLRFAYQSLATPSSVIDFNMRTKEKTVLKEQEVLGGKFDKNNYVITSYSIHYTKLYDSVSKRLI